MKFYNQCPIDKSGTIFIGKYYHIKYMKKREQYRVTLVDDCGTHYASTFFDESTFEEWREDHTLILSK